MDHASGIDITAPSSTTSARHAGVAEDLDAGGTQPIAHVGAHLAKSDESKLHG